MNTAMLKLGLKSASAEDKIEIVKILLDSLKKDQIKQILIDYGIKNENS